MRGARLRIAMLRFVSAPLSLLARGRSASLDVGEVAFAATDTAAAILAGVALIALALVISPL